MSHDWFEKGMNDKLGTHESDLDLHQAWSELQSRRAPEKKKRRGLVWWWTGGLLLPLLVVGSYIAINNFSSGKIKDTHKTNTTIKQQKDIFKSTKTQLNTKTPNSKPITKEQNKPSVKRTIQTKQSTKKKSGSSKIYANKRTDNTTNIATNKTNTQHLSPTAQNSTPTNSFDKSRASNSVALSLLSTNAISNIEVKPLQLVLLEKENLLPSPALTENKKQAKNNIGLSLAYGKAFKNLSSQGNSAYAKRRNQTESTLDAIQYSLFYHRYLNKNIIIGVSGSYAQSTDVLKNDYMVENPKLFTNQVLIINNISEGEQELIMGDAFGTETERTSVRLYQKQKQASIELNAGFAKELKDGFTYKSIFGLGTTLFNKIEGSALATTGSNTEYIDLNKSAYYRNAGIMYASLSLEIGKKFDNNFEIYIGLKGISDLSSRSVSTAPFSEKRQFLLGQISLIRSF